MLQNMIDSLEYTVKSCENLLSKEDVIRDNLKSTEKDIKEKEDYLKFLKGAKDKYAIAVNELYENSIGALKDTLNVALSGVREEIDVLVYNNIKPVHRRRSGPRPPPWRWAPSGTSCGPSRGRYTPAPGRTG